MLDYKIINKKPIITNKSEEYIDLLAPTFVLDSNIGGTMIVVNQYYVARPDLISLAIYGDDQYGDIICKVNGISNPFELNENDILFIPSPDVLTSLTKTYNQASDIIENTNETLGKTDIIDNRKKISERRSPNELILGDSNYTIDHSLGLVFY